MKNKTESELLKEKEHYEFMKNQYSKGSNYWVKDAIIKDSIENLKEIEEELNKRR